MVKRAEKGLQKGDVPPKTLLLLGWQAVVPALGTQQSSLEAS